MKKNLFQSILALLIFTSATAQFDQLVWANHLSSADDVEAFVMDTDTLNTIFIAGSFGGTVDFDPTSSSFELTSAGFMDAFVSRYDMNGNFAWAVKFGSTSFDNANSVVVDQDGNILISGNFSLTVDFDPGSGTTNLVSTIGSADGFLLKLDANGNFLWVKQFTSKYNVIVTSVDVDGSGNIYCGGSFSDTADFDPGSGVYNLVAPGAPGNEQAFVCKMDASGNFIWAKGMGGTSNDKVNCIKVDASGNVFSTGSFSGTADFDPGAGTSNLVSKGVTGAFIHKLDANGTFQWVDKKDGNSNDAGYSLALDATGNVHVTGYTYMFSENVFIWKLDATGSSLWDAEIWATGFNRGHSIYVDAAGNVYTTGYFSGTMDFDPSPTDTFELTAPLNDAFLSVLDQSGNFVSAINFGDGFFTMGNAVTKLGSDVLIMGQFMDTCDVDPSSKVQQLVSAGASDLFLLRLADQTVGLDDQKGKESPSVKIYPNPTSDQLNIDLGEKCADVSIRLSNLQGQLVNRWSFENVQSLSLDITAEKGIYILQVYTEKGQNSFKVLKE